MAKSYPVDLRAIQKTALGWQAVDNIGTLAWVTSDGNKYLRGNIDSLGPSVGNPVKIFVE
jgi:hypothetical protein